MKKSFLYLSVMAILAVAFSSCLGDNESTISNSGVFTVVQQSSGTLFVPVLINTGAGTSVVKVTGSGLSGQQAGDAVFVSYKLNLDKWASSSMLEADYVTVSPETFPKPYKNIREQAMDTTVNNSPLKLGIISADMYDYMGNMWLLNVAAEVQGDQTIDAVFSYNSESQKQQDGKDLPDNTYIIDVVLVKRGEVAEGAAKKTKEQSLVVDFTTFRRDHKPSNIGKEGAVVNLWFRYISVDAASKKVLNYWNPKVGFFYQES